MLAHTRFEEIGELSLIFSFWLGTNKKEALIRAMRDRIKYIITTNGKNINPKKGYQIPNEL